MKVIEVEGRSLDDALRKAGQEMGVDPSEIDRNNVEIVDEGKAGIFGFGVSRPAKIRVFWNVEIADVGEEVKRILFDVLKLMEIDAVISQFHEAENKVYIELESKDSGLIIGKKGKTLEALQFMINLIVNQKTGTDKKIILDIETYRAKREKALKRRSRDVAAKVARTGKPWTLEPMNPFERRLVHLALQNDDRVVTKSEGQGIYRKVKVLPKNHVENDK
jgi:spoIIIJ-associated protein